MSGKKNPNPDNNDKRALRLSEGPTLSTSSSTQALTAGFREWADLQEEFLNNPIKKYRYYFGKEKSDEEVNILIQSEGDNLYEGISLSQFSRPIFLSWRKNQLKKRIPEENIYVMDPVFQQLLKKQAEEEAIEEMERMFAETRAIRHVKAEEEKKEDEYYKQLRIERNRAKEKERHRQMAEECTTDSCNIMGGRKQTKKRRNQFRKKSKKTKTKRHRRLRFRRPVSYHR